MDWSSSDVSVCASNHVHMYEKIKSNLLVFFIFFFFFQNTADAFPTIFVVIFCIFSSFSFLFLLNYEVLFVFSSAYRTLCTTISYQHHQHHCVCMIWRKIKFKCINIPFSIYQLVFPRITSCSCILFSNIEWFDICLEFEIIPIRLSIETDILQCPELFLHDILMR